MKIIDLSKEIYDKMPVYPGDPEVSIEKFSDIDHDGWDLLKITFGSHTSTHVDGFSHMKKGGSSLSEMPLDRFMGEAQKVKSKDYYPKDIGLIFEEEIGIDKFLKIKKSNPKFVAGNIDIDLEKALLNDEIITYTDLINLDKIPLNESFIFIALPLKIRNADGSPVRAIAILKDN